METGTANGTDRSDAQRAAVADVLGRIESLNANDAPARVDLTGTDWELVYTDSSGNSSGKIGPFLGRVTQARKARGFRPSCDGTIAHTERLCRSCRSRHWVLPFYMVPVSSSAAPTPQVFAKSEVSEVSEEGGKKRLTCRHL